MIKQQERKEEFFQALDALGTGGRAALRRAAGTGLAEANGMALQTFFHCLPYGVPEGKTEYWYAAACFHCIWKEQERDPLIEIFGRLARNEMISASTQKRMIQLLDQKWDRDGFLLAKLARFLKIIKQQGYAVDCSELLDDLLGWNREDRMVQRKWARLFYQIKEEKENKIKGSV